MGSISNIIIPKNILDTFKDAGVIKPQSKVEEDFKFRKDAANPGTPNVGPSLIEERALLPLALVVTQRDSIVAGSLYNKNDLFNYVSNKQDRDRLREYAQSLDGNKKLIRQSADDEKKFGELEAQSIKLISGSSGETEAERAERIKKREAVLDELKNHTEKSPSINAMLDGDSEKVNKFLIEMVKPHTENIKLEIYTQETALGNTAVKVTNLQDFHLDIQANDARQPIVLKSDGKNLTVTLPNVETLQKGTLDAEKVTAKVNSTDVSDVYPEYKMQGQSGNQIIVPDTGTGVRITAAKGQTIDLTDLKGKDEINKKSIRIEGAPAVIKTSRDTDADIRLELSNAPVAVQMPSATVIGLKDGDIRIMKGVDGRVSFDKEGKEATMLVNYSAGVDIKNNGGVHLQVSHAREEQKVTVPVVTKDKEGKVIRDLSKMSKEEQIETIAQETRVFGGDVKGENVLTHKEVSLELVSPSGKNKEKVTLIEDGKMQFLKEDELKEKLKKTHEALVAKDAQDKVQQKGR